MSETPGLSDDAWDRAFAAGARTAETALKTRIARRIERGDSVENAVAVLTGALVETATMILEVTNPARRAAVERKVLAMVRGALAGAEGPLNEDGSHHGDW